MSRKSGGPRTVGSQFSSAGHDLRDEAPEESGPVKRYPIIEWATDLGYCRNGVSITIMKRAGIGISKMARSLLQLEPGDRVGVGFDNMRQCALLRKEESGPDVGFRLSQSRLLGRVAKQFLVARGFTEGVHAGQIDDKVLVVPLPALGTAKREEG